MNKTAEIFESLKDEFKDTDLSLDPEGKIQPWIMVPSDAIRKISKFLRDAQGLRYDTLMCLSGVHYPDPEEELLGVTYHLHSTKHAHTLVLKVKVPLQRPRVQSVESTWKTANWHEREAYDMFGILFEGHPDLSRILCPDDWEGHPLRKDYEYPECYHDIKIPY